MFPAPSAWAGKAPVRRPTRDGHGVVRLRLSADDRRLLDLLAELPFLWPAAMAAIVGGRSDRLYRRLARLQRAGLVTGGRPAVWPFRWAGRGGTPRLLYLTGDTGGDKRRGVLTRQGGGPGSLPGLAHRVATYALL